MKRKLWITTFEFGPAKLGGLGEVPTNQAKHLQDDLDITVLIPAHGLIHGDDQKNIISHVLATLTFTQRFKGIETDPENHFLDGFPGEADVTVQAVAIQIPFPSVTLVSFTGLDPLSRKVLDDPVIYSKTGLKAKIALYSNALKHYTAFIANGRADELPVAVHVHDYHTYPGIIASRQILLERGLDMASIFTVHLLTWPKVTVEYLECCGIDVNVSLPFFAKHPQSANMKSLIPAARQRLEYIACCMSDVVTSVSRAYLEENVVSNCGGPENLAGKTDFIHDGCDWDHDTIMAHVIEENERDLSAFLGRDVSKSGPSREELRRYLLTWKLEHMQPGEPAIPDDVLLQEIKKFDRIPPFKDDGRVTCFPKDGKLVLLTGRASKQKGIETLFAAIPAVLEAHPDAKFLFKLIPTQGEFDLISKYNAMAVEPAVRDNVRIVWGKGTSVFLLSHIAADVYVGPSRWEPFGIMILEANAVGLPAIGTKVGGMKETIVDIREDHVNGTGVLVEPDDPVALATMITDFLHMVDAKQADIRAITDPILQRLVQDHPLIYEVIRGNARHRVESSFRWKQVSQKVLALIDKAIQVSQAYREKSP